MAKADSLLRRTRRQAGASPPGLRCSTVAVRVKRCGKSAPLAQQCSRHGKPHTEQDQIGKELEMAQAISSACRLGAPGREILRLLGVAQDFGCGLKRPQNAS